MPMRRTSSRSSTVPPGHRLLGRAAVTLEDLKDKIIVGSERTPGYDQLAGLLTHTGTPLMLTGHGVRRLPERPRPVAAGDGVAVIPYTRPYSGEGGIRTPDGRVTPITVFETAAFNRSATSPGSSKR